MCVCVCVCVCVCLHVFVYPDRQKSCSTAPIPVRHWIHMDCRDGERANRIIMHLSNACCCKMSWQVFGLCPPFIHPSIHQFLPPSILSFPSLFQLSVYLHTHSFQGNFNLLTRRLFLKTDNSSLFGFVWKENERWAFDK